MTHTIDDLLEAIEFARMTPDHEHLNTVDTLAIELFAAGVISKGQLHNASALARQPLDNA